MIHGVERDQRHVYSLDTMLIMCRRPATPRSPMSTTTFIPTATAAALLPERSLEHVDVLIVGAGLSGIGAACHLQANCPGKSYAILEARDAIGGTWDLFRYPGIRSDSDMF